jgi:hypothetical protein
LQSWARLKDVMNLLAESDIPRLANAFKLLNMGFDNAIGFMSKPENKEIPGVLGNLGIDAAGLSIAKLMARWFPRLGGFLASGFKGDMMSTALEAAGLYTNPLFPHFGADENDARIAGSPRLMNGQWWGPIPLPTSHPLYSQFPGIRTPSPFGTRGQTFPGVAPYQWNRLPNLDSALPMPGIPGLGTPIPGGAQPLGPSQHLRSGMSLPFAHTTNNVQVHVAITALLSELIPKLIAAVTAALQNTLGTHSGPAGGPTSAFTVGNPPPT